MKILKTNLNKSPYRRPVLFVAVLFGMLLISASCSNHESVSEHSEPETITARVATVEWVRHEVPIEIQGVVEPRRRSFVSGRVAGPVTAVHVESGDRVKKGDLLIEIEPRAARGQVAQAKGALAQAKAALALAERNFERYRSLHENGAASALELDMARMQFDSASGAVTQAEGAVAAASSVAEEAEVRAPFNADVAARMAQVGDFAAPGRPLVELHSRDGKRLSLTVSESDFDLVQDGGEVPVRFDSRSDLGEIVGRVVEIVPAADPATHTFTVRVDLGSADVLSGLAGRAFLSGQDSSVLAIPREAIRRAGGLEMVVVRDAEGRARSRMVTTGSEMDGDRIEVLSGLKQGDTVLLGLLEAVPEGSLVEVQS